MPIDQMKSPIISPTLMLQIPTSQINHRQKNSKPKSDKLNSKDKRRSINNKTTASAQFEDDSDECQANARNVQKPTKKDKHPKTKDDKKALDEGDM